MADTLQSTEVAGLHIGAAVYVFDENRRVYAKGSIGGPIYREHFRPQFIVGEEKRSWLVSAHPDGKYPQKVGKVTAEKSLLTSAQVEDQCWLNSNRYRLARRVEMCADVGTLKAIAATLGYNPESAS